MWKIKCSALIITEVEAPAVEKATAAAESDLRITDTQRTPARHHPGFAAVFLFPC